MRIGTVGTNFIVNRFIEAAQTIPSVEVTAVYSRDAGKAAEFAAGYGIKKSYSDREAFLADEELDVIYVAAPNSLHYSWSRDALLAGRSVICEKPFVSRTEELERLIALAMERGLFLFEALTIPHLPNYRLVKEQLAALGPLKMAQLNFSQYSSRYDAHLRGEDPNAFSPAFSGGALMDLNYYNLNFVVGLWGAPEDLTYFPNIAENGIDTSGTLILKYPGHLAVCTACKDSKSQNFVMIQGERGYIFSRATSSNLSGGFTVCTDGGEQHYDEQDAPNLSYEIASFAKVFQKGDRSACDAPLAESLNIARLMDKARKGAGILFQADSEALV